MTTQAKYGNRYENPLTSAVLVRLTPEVHELIRQAADRTDMGLGEFIREAAIGRLHLMGLIPVDREDAVAAAARDEA